MVRLLCLHISKPPKKSGKNSNDLFSHCSPQPYPFSIGYNLTAKKAFEQEAAALGQLYQLGIETPQQLFTVFSGISGCKDRKISESDQSEITEGTGCLLCAIPRKKGISEPCTM